MVVGKSRIKMPALAVDAVMHGAAECGLRPGADAGVRVGRDVAAIDGAEWRLDRIAAGVSRTAGLGVADDATADRGQSCALGDNRGIIGGGVHGADRRDLGVPSPCAK